MNAQDWAFQEMDLRRQEDAKFPCQPCPGSTAMHMERKRRRRERGYSKKVADDLVKWVEEMDRKDARQAEMF